MHLAKYALCMTLAIFCQQAAADGRDWSETPAAPFMSINRTQHPPIIDGNFSPDQWADAAAISSFQTLGEGYVHPPAIFYLTYDDEYFYFAARVFKNEPKWFRPINRFRDSWVHLDPNIHIMLAPPGRKQLFHFCINPYGAIQDAIANIDINYREVGYTGDIQTASSQTQEEWFIEGRIALASLGVERINDGDTWHANFLNGRAAWSSRHWWNMRFEKLGILHAREEAPVVQWLDPYPLLEGKLQLEVSIRNRSPQQNTYILSGVVTGETAEDALASARQQITLQPGERRLITLAAEETFEGKRGHVELSCTSADGSTVYYHQIMRLDGKQAGAAQRAAEAFREGAPLPQDIFISARYGQMVNALEAQADTWFLRLAGNSPSRVEFSITPKGRPDEVVARHEVTRFQKDFAICLINMPDTLPFGEYRLTAQVYDTQDRLLARDEAWFERLDLASPDVNKPFRGRDGRILDWIGNNVGKTDRVLSPWTPIRLERGNSVLVWGRNLSVDQNGFFGQIVTQGESILSAPMSVVMRSNGRQIPLKVTQRPDITANIPHSEAKWRSVMKAGDIEVEIAAILEYDGLVKYTVRLRCEKGVELDDLYVDIPLRSNVARWYLVQLGMSAIPDGDGLVWESSRDRNDNLMGTLVPFVWLGNHEYGLNWAADNTRGWYEQPGESVLTLTREADTLHLRVHLVRGPVLVESTEMEFSLLPTPTKPAPQGIRYMGLTPEWNYFWFTGWHNIAEKLDGRDAIAWDDPTPENIEQGKARSVGANRQTLALPYTNPTFTMPHPMPWVVDEISPVVPIMLEEWANFPAGWRPVNPVDTYRDWAAANMKYWMLKQGYAGYYVDEPYASDDPDYNLLNGSGWFDRHGNLRGSYHVMNTRELLKRMYAITHQYSRTGTPFMMVHASNFGMSPLWTSFSTVVNFGEADWSIDIAGYGMLDWIAQDNMIFYSGKALGYTGTIFGTRSWGSREKQAESTRYVHGEMLLYDFLPNTWENYQGARDVADMKLEFGIGEADVEFFGYWQDDCPARSSNEIIRASVYRRPGRSLLVVLNTDRKEQREAEIEIDARSLYKAPGFWQIIDAENGEQVATDGNRVGLRLAPRDVKYFYVVTHE